MEALGFDLASYLTLAQLMRCARNEHCAAYVFQSDASAETTRDKGLVALQRRHANEIDRAKADHGIGAQKGSEAAPQKQRDYLYRLLDLAQEGNSYAMNILIREQLRYEQDLLSQKDVPQEQVPLTTLFRRMEVPDADIKEFVRAREAGRRSE